MANEQSPQFCVNDLEIPLLGVFTLITEDYFFAFCAFTMSLIPHDFRAEDLTWHNTSDFKLDHCLILLILM